MNKLLTCLLTCTLLLAFSVVAYADVIWTPMDTVREFALPTVLVLAVVAVTAVLIVFFKKKKK